jgi:tryptophanyl-tRNA synthetase
MGKQRVLSGMRPTGRLHLGHFHGALANWKKLQDTYSCFFFIADWHALTSEYSHPDIIKGSIKDMLIDWLGVGIDPDKSTIFLQSRMPEHAELHVILSMITPLGWLERCPTYKEQQQELPNKDLSTYGFLGYPVLQAADILAYKAHKVPVGVDQLPHLELTREITRRFHYLYKEIFPLPEPLLTETPKILGTDGRKMSKTYGNAIYLSDPLETIKKKVSQMVTDPKRMRRHDPGDPEVSSVFSLHKIYTPGEELGEIAEGCRTATIGCVECKKRLSDRIIESLHEYREKRRFYLEHPNILTDVLEVGVGRAREFARATLEEVKQAVQLV